MAKRADRFVVGSMRGGRVYIIGKSGDGISSTEAMNQRDCRGWVLNWQMIYELVERPDLMKSKPKRKARK